MSMAVQQQPLAQQLGGANPLGPILNNLDSTPHLLYGFLILLIITFVDQVPASIGRHIDTALGRVLGIAAVGAVTHYLGFSYGLLTAIAFLLLVHISPRLAATGTDGFYDYQSQNSMGTQWFVEQVLGENNVAIQNDRVNTSAVQDLSEKTMSKSSSGK
jgi:hypothetical protein